MACTQKATEVHDMIRRALRWTTQRQRSRGRAKETWKMTVEKDLIERGLSLETAPLTAADRPRWRALQLPQAPDGPQRIERASETSKGSQLS
ncbi:carboxylic ester hydrolase [Elysia marginata]|uniref:Carboxylic ester hydrolase n=1 Tax=Elysia marginata TaxID=1093978 RepID=A0AAV4F976_9GAST|nr:carboxylic ester hydrolase [Elysia marginata]